ncbi:MAG: TetR family transcriptional regulator [Myxococcota bacterium]
MPKRRVNPARNPSAKPAANEGRRETILDAALGLIARQGFAAVSHRRVAAAAGVPLGSTTYYFESREHLLREAFRRYLAQTSAELADGARALKERPTLARALDYLLAYTEREVADRAVIVTEYELVLFAARDGSLAEELHAWYDAMVADLAEVLERLGARTPFDAARAVFQMVRGYELEALTRGEPRTADLRRRLETLLTSYLASSGA